MPDKDHDFLSMDFLFDKEWAYKKIMSPMMTVGFVEVLDKVFL
jgi:hypothetical protein